MKTATSSSSSTRPTDVNFELLEAMAAGLKRVYEDGDFRKEIAKHLS